MANQSVIDNFGDLYPEDPTQGSPFDTGTANAITPEFKRFAAFQGDVVFQAPRRFFIQQRAAHQPIWSFRKSSPIPLGVYLNFL
jgi:acetylcholinesterase